MRRRQIFVRRIPKGIASLRPKLSCYLGTSIAIDTNPNGVVALLIKRRNAPWELPEVATLSGRHQQGTR